MRLPLLAVITAMLIFSTAPAAHAGKFCFGVDESLQTIQKVDVKGAEGEPLSLARKIRMDCFLLPYTVTDEGYVLAKDDGKSYYDLSAEQVTEFQKAGTLPDPLPEFNLSTFDLIMGHALWILIAVVAGWTAFDYIRKPKDDAPAE